MSDDFSVSGMNFYGVRNPILHQKERCRLNISTFLRL